MTPHTLIRYQSSPRTGGEDAGAAHKALEARGDPLPVLDGRLELLHLSEFSIEGMGNGGRE